MHSIPDKTNYSAAPPGAPLASCPGVRTVSPGVGCAFHPLDVAQLANLPAKLQADTRFVCWREETRNAKATKIPVDCHAGADAESDNPATWSTFAEAVGFYQAHRDTLHGVGRMFDSTDGIIGVDFDDCLDAQSNIIRSHAAAEWLPRLNSYCEISPSGQGVKLWVKAVHKLDGKTGRRDAKRGVEIYGKRRFFTITGRRLSQFSANVEVRQTVVDDFYSSIFCTRKNGDARLSALRPHSNAALSGADVINRASNAKNGAKFRALWAGNIDGYGSQSEADLALCSMLYFWTGDREAVCRLFEQSALGQREKWAARSDYQEATLDVACKGEVYSPTNLRPQPPAVPTANITLSSEYGPALVGDSGHQTINQAHFAARYVTESGIVHDPAVRRFYIYVPTTGLWQHQTADATTREISLCFQRIVKEAGCPHFLAKRTANMLGGLRELARGISEQRGVFNQRRDAIHVANGMLVLGNNGTVELKSFAPEWYSRNRSEIRWNANADCPRFMSELLLAAMPEEDVRLVQRYFGQCLLGVNLSQTFLILRGTPGGGKTTLANIIEGVIGRHNVTELRIAQLCERFELIRFVDRTLLSGKDVPGDFLNMKPAHVLKALVGGDTLEGEVKHGNESFSIEGHKNVLISTNTRLRVKLDSDAGAWGRRTLIVDYARPKPTKPIPGFDSMLLQEEGEGILRWAVAGAIQLKQELAATGTIQLTEAQRRRVDDLLSESDSVRSFFRERIEQHHGGEIVIHELTALYRDYCETRDWEPVRDRHFQAELPDAMLEYHRATKRNDIRRDGKSARGFRGVRLQAGSERPSETSEPQDPGDEQPSLSDGSDGHRKLTPHERGDDSNSKAGNNCITSGQASEASEPTEKEAFSEQL